MKRFSFFLFFIISTSFIFAERYQIKDVRYFINGMTREYALEKIVDIEKDRIFESYEEFRIYIDDLTNQFNSERNLSSAIVNVSYDPTLSEGNICFTTLNIMTQDSKHFLALPYPKYDSNEGFLLKLKMKDTNFLGTMETLDFDLNFAIEHNDDENKDDVVFGVNFDYDYPFKLWKVDSSWNNTFSIDYTMGETKPEFEYETGFTFSIPFSTYSLQIDFTQGIERNFDYLEYDDDLFYTEYAKFSIPITVANIDNWGKVEWTPFVDYTLNWDDNGIEELNEDLTSPIFSVGHEISSGRISWIGNFRQGVDFTISQNLGYNYQKSEYLASVNGSISLHKAFKYFGFSSRIQGFGHINKTEKIGSYLRGIKDDQEYKDLDIEALKVKTAIVCNIDIPIKIMKTNWNGWTESLFGEESWIANNFRWMRYFDFELQVVPFFDFALSNNLQTERTFSILDGWYAGGLEVLVYPAKWRSLVVRASAGVDVGRKIMPKVVSPLIDTWWRSECSAFELYIGIGLHY